MSFSHLALATQGLVLDEQFDHAELGLFSDYIRAPGDRLSIDEVQKSEQWTRSHREVPNFGFTSDHYWFRIALSPQQNFSSLILEVSYALLDSVEVYVERDGEVIDQQRAGNTVPFAERKLPHRLLLFPLQLDASKHYVLYLHVASTNSMQVPISLWTERAFWQRDQLRSVFQGLYYGIVLVMMLYNLFLYFSLKDKSYLHYVYLVLSVATFQSCLHGVAYAYLWPGLTWWNEKCVGISIAFCNGFFLLFCITFLQYKAILPRIYVVQRFLMQLSFLCAALVLVVPSTLMVAFITFVVMIASLSVITLWYSMWNTNRSVRFFFIAWGIFVSGTQLMVLSKFGLIEYGFLSENALQIGSALESFLLSLALGERIKLMEVQRMNARQAELRAREEALELMHRERQAVLENQAKSSFLAAMSHEIRTPMNGVLGIAELLKSTPLNSQQRDYIDTLYSSGQSLLTIINDILDYSKIEAGRIELESIQFDLSKLVDDSLSLLLPRALEKNIQLMSVLAPDVPFQVLGDPGRIRQILLNLVGNAIKFTEQGFVYLSVKLAAPVAADGKLDLHFDVVDTGIGMSAEQVARLFQSYSQADASVTRKYGGTGLGLVISKRLVEAMGGVIGVSSESGRGSKFWFDLNLAVPETAPAKPVIPSRSTLVLCEQPVLFALLKLTLEASGFAVKRMCRSEQLSDQTEAELAQFECIFGYCPLDDDAFDAMLERVRKQHLLGKTIFAATPAQRHKIGSSLAVVELPLTNYRLVNNLQAGESEKAAASEDTVSMQLNVLVAEDNKVNQMVVKGLLKQLGISPVFANNGVEVVDLFCDASKHFDLILMDCEMPELDGFEAAQKIRSWEQSLRRKSTPIIALTAHILNEYIEKATQVGMNGYLSKPIDKAALSAMLQQFANG